VTGSAAERSTTLAPVLRITAWNKLEKQPTIRGLTAQRNVGVRQESILDAFQYLLA
jgi:hypothetical protein